MYSALALRAFLGRHALQVCPGTGELGALLLAAPRWDSRDRRVRSLPSFLNDRFVAVPLRSSEDPIQEHACSSDGSSIRGEHCIALRGDRVAAVLPHFRAFLRGLFQGAVLQPPNCG